MPTPQVIVLGSINMDLVVHGPRLPQPGETVVGGRFEEVPGGKGANQATAAARLGESPVLLLAAHGDDSYGGRLRASLATEQICLDHLLECAGWASGVAAILVDAAGENCISVASGANALLSEADVAGLPENAWQEARVFLASLEVPLDTVHAGLKTARRHGLRTILNPAPANELAARPELLANVDLLTPNLREAEQLAGMAIDSLSDAITAAERMQQYGPEIVIITRGRNGAVLVAESVKELPAIEVPVVDTTAAGDCFNGALAVRLAAGDEIDSAVKFANRAAAISVTRSGAGPSMPRRVEIGLCE